MAKSKPKPQPAPGDPGDPGDPKLETYRGKRDFRSTAEPAGGGRGRSPTGRLFVVQKHAARRLHYDFRLELDGVLKSWAVPRGPSLDPAQKPLAVQTEDHPLEYADFEGVIPKGEYGGGTVMVWDTGEWEPMTDDPHEGLAKGDFKFRLHGGKLRGEFVLARMKPKPGESDRNWLLIKKRDDFARPIGEYNILGEEPRSALTNRTLDEITADADAVWSSGGRMAGAKKTAKSQPKGESKSRGGKTPRVKDAWAAEAAALPGAKPTALPAAMKPQLAVASSSVPPGDDWLHEIKLDGYRFLCLIDGGEPRFITRNGHDWTQRLGALPRDVRTLALHDTILDGEVVVLDDHGRSSFQALQNAFRGGSAPMIYYVFDIPFAAGFDLRKTPLLERKRLLRQIFDARGDGDGTRVQYCDHIVGRGETFLERAAEAGLEGIISKRADAPYEERRSHSWLKIKHTQRQDFVIGGWTDPSGSRSGFGALLLGHYNDDGELIYCGRVGTGFSDRRLEEIFAMLQQRATDDPPFINFRSDPDWRKAHWAQPELIAEVEFGSWTDDDLIRHPAFIALREDIDPKDVRREVTSAEAFANNNHDGPAMQSAGPPPASTSSSSTVVRAQNVVRSPQSPKDTSVEGVRISNPDRTVYPDDGVTKGDVARYYAAIAEWMLPHVAKRPMSLVRCPLGLAGEFFFQRELGKGWPEAIRGIRIGDDHAMVIDDAAGLVSLAQMGALELHNWQCREDNTDRPDQMVIDLDPGEGIEWEHITASARLIGEFLRDLGLESFPKTTGGKGMHLVVPLVRRSGWEEVKSFALAIAKHFAQLAPRNFTATMAKEMRTNRIYIDYLRNQEGATSVAPYSTRARNGAHVSAPLTWEEVAADITPGKFTVRTMPRRMQSREDDPWQGFFDLRQSITKKMKKEMGMR